MRVRWLTSQFTGTRATFTLLALAFSGWAILFIWRTSFIALDGQRYFSLFDDAMISMRYAWNLAHGLGPVWNPTQPVEGYTNPLMVLVMAIPSALMNKPFAVLSVQVGGILTTLAIAAVAARMYRLVGLHGPRCNEGRFPWLVFLAVLAYYPLVYFTLMGMETGLVSLLLTTMLYLAILARHKPRTLTFVALGISAGLAFLARPDSIMFTAVVALYILLSRRNFKGSARRKWRLPLISLLIFLAIVVAGRVFAYTFYGSFIPNTVLLKIVGVPLSVKLLDGFGYIMPYLVQTTPLLVLCLGGMVFDARPDKLLLGGVPILAVVYQIEIGGDPWPYWRVMAISFPALIVMSIFSLEALATAFANTEFSSRYFRRRPLLSTSALIPTWVTLGLLAALYLANRPFAGEIVGRRLPYTVSENLRNVNTAIAIRAVTCPNGEVGVFWAGAIPYFSERFAIDFLGKSDAHIASLPPDISGAVSWSGMSSVPGHNKYDLDYSIRSLKPTYVQGLEWGSQNLEEWSLSHYTPASYKGVELLLLSESHCVLWHQLDT